jgi:hypothetical protein
MLPLSEMLQTAHGRERKQDLEWVGCNVCCLTSKHLQWWVGAEIDCNVVPCALSWNSRPSKGCGVVVWCMYSRLCAA